ncbi:MAG TPA: hypothetical protein VFV01_15705 [Spirillospora sp.]|nr:hypothetical protein [Spirillospora sp.]
MTVAQGRWTVGVEWTWTTRTCPSAPGCSPGTPTARRRRSKAIASPRTDADGVYSVPTLAYVKTYRDDYVDVR